MSDNNAAELSSSVRQRFVVIQTGQSPADALEAVETDKTILRQAAQKGAIWVRRRRTNGQMAKLVRLRNLDEDVLDGSELFANINPDVLNKEVDAPTLIESHPNYSFWFKPRGVLSQGSKWGDHTSMPTLVEADQKRATHLVHRLDRSASGLMLLAHTRPAVKALTALFAKRQVEKRYRVVVKGDWSEALPHDIQQRLDDQKAHTEIETLLEPVAKGASTLELRIHTGRKHQIRRHLADMGFPVLGDHRYGEAKPGSDEPLALMATELKFTCPFSKKTVAVSLPDTDTEKLL